MSAISRLGAVLCLCVFVVLLSGCGGGGSEIARVKHYAIQGDPEAQYWLGVCYETGEGVPQNDVLAYAWLAMSAEKGNKQAVYERDVLAREFSDVTLRYALERTEVLRGQLPFAQYAQ